MAPDRTLTDAQVAQFIQDGFVRIDDAFPAALAAQARDILWRELACDPHDPTTWTQPVVRLGMHGEPPFVQAAGTPRLRGAFDQLVGAGRWLPCQSVGTFPVRFPFAGDPGDAGWHVDMSFDWHRPDFMDWRINIHSKGRALLMLLLFSDVGALDAPTRLLPGSHLDVARRLAPAGDDGMTMRDLAAWLPSMPQRPQALATGSAGTVFLCHPFLVHGAQPHRGTAPRFLAQPPLLPRVPLRLDRAEADCSAVELAIRRALA
jgi:hypothetical protein